MRIIVQDLKLCMKFIFMFKSEKINIYKIKDSNVYDKQAHCRRILPP